MDECPHKKRAQESSFPLFLHVCTEEGHRRRPSPEPSHVGVRVSDFLVSRTVRNKYWVLELPSLPYSCYSSLSRLRQRVR